MRRAALRLALLLILMLAQAAAAADHPLIREIAFEGNDTTQPKTMLREMVIAVGRPANPADVEKSRQAVLDLGLFKSVRVKEEPVAGGVRLVFVVDERYYILPTPRLDAKSDGTNSYGAQLRWNNVAGLNHTLRITWASSDRQQRNVGRETSYAASYAAPFVFDRRNGFSVGGGYTTRPVEGTAGPYEETFRSFQLSGTRSLSEGPPSQGWIAGAGLSWTRQDTIGEFAPRPYGEATAPILTANYRDLHYKVYSEQGTAYGLRLEGTREGWLSDYDYLRLAGSWLQYIEVGDTPHQTLHLIVGAGTYHGGPPDTNAFGLGGASLLRAYEKNFIEGDAYYYVATEFARPLFWHWLRGVVMLEAGNVFDDAGNASLDKVYTSLGLGLRLRLSNFVDLEIEAGWAIPLDGGAGRFFASRV